MVIPAMEPLLRPCWVEATKGTEVTPTGWVPAPVLERGVAAIVEEDMVVDVDGIEVAGASSAEELELVVVIVIVGAAVEKDDGDEEEVSIVLVVLVFIDVEDTYDVDGWDDVDDAGVVYGTDEVDGWDDVDDADGVDGTDGGTDDIDGIDGWDDVDGTGGVDDVDEAAAILVVIVFVDISDS